MAYRLIWVIRMLTKSPRPLKRCLEERLHYMGPCHWLLQTFWRMAIMNFLAQCVDESHERHRLTE